MYSKIIQRIFTSNEREQVLEALEQIGKKLYLSDGNGSNDVLSKKISAKFYDSLSKLFDEQKSISEKERLIQGLKDEIKSMQEVKITIAFEPTKKTEESVGSWLKKNVSERSFASFEYDPSIVAGALIISNGEYRDYTIASRLDETFAKKKTEYMNILRETS